MQRHAGGGAIAVACLPALVGAWRDPAGGALLSTSGTIRSMSRRWNAPTSSGAAANVNMSVIGDACSTKRAAHSRHLRL
jgi:hypothetical protein